MSPASTFFSLLICTGCVELVASESPHAVDEYSIAARSWIGADIEEMLAAWPNPNMQCGRNTIGEAGCVWWRHNQTPASGGTPAYDYRCEAIARYNEAGVITRIDVRKSLYCYRRFNDRFDRMTRPISRKGLEVEELGR